MYKQSRGVAFFVQRQSKIDTFHDFAVDVNGGYALGTYWILNSLGKTYQKAFLSLKHDKK